MSLMGMGDYTYANAFCAKQYAVEADFDGMLFSTADQNLVFNAYYSSLYDGWGGIGLSRMPDRNAAAPSSKQQFSVWADGGANGYGNLCRILRFQLADGNVSRIPE